MFIALLICSVIANSAFVSSFAFAQDDKIAVQTKLFILGVFYPPNNLTSYCATVLLRYIGVHKNARSSKYPRYSL